MKHDTNTVTITQTEHKQNRNKTDAQHKQHNPAITQTQHKHNIFVLITYWLKRSIPEVQNF